jgi:uncharacterized membrane protein YphA (DoxX/SURF4 family)
MVMENFLKLFSDQWTLEPIGQGLSFHLFLLYLVGLLHHYLCVGYKTKAAIPSLITMLVATFIVHADDPMGY